MRKNKHAESEAPLLNCSWCEDEIPDDVEVLTIGARAKPGVDLGAAEGKIIPLILIQANRTVSAIVPTRDSPAAKSGHDLIFTICGESCAQALRNALNNDWRLLDASIE